MSLEAASYDSARWRPWCDGRMVIDIEFGVTVPSMYPARTSEQPCLGVALLTPNGEGNIKGFLKKLTPIRLVRKPRRASHPILRSKRYNKYMHMECENITR